MTTSLVRYHHPWGLFRDIDRIFAETTATVGGRWTPNVDVFDDGTDVMVRADVAGSDPADIDVTVEDGVLTIKGSRTFDTEDRTQGFHRREIATGSFVRSVRLPAGVDADAVTAASKDGIIEITVPRKPEVLPRKVSVEVQR